MKEKKYQVKKWRLEFWCIIFTPKPSSMYCNYGSDERNTNASTHYLCSLAGRWLKDTSPFSYPFSPQSFIKCSKVFSFELLLSTCFCWKQRENHIVDSPDGPFAFMTRTRIGVLLGSHHHHAGRIENFCRLGLRIPLLWLWNIRKIALKCQENYSSSPCLKSLLSWKHHWDVPLPPYQLWVLPKGFMTHIWATVQLPQLRKGGQEEMLALTSAGAAPSADAEGHGAVPRHGAGLQHSLHVLVLSSILGILQALGLALAGWGAAGELAGLREEKDLSCQLNSMGNRPGARLRIARKEVSSQAWFGVGLFPKEPSNSCSSPRAFTVTRNKPETGWQQGADTVRERTDALVRAL